MKKYSGLLVLTVCIVSYYLLNFDLFKKNGNKPDSNLPFLLIEKTDELGIGHKHVFDTVHKSIEHLNGYLMSLGASVAVADVNNDGWQDMYLCNLHRNEPNHLYMNNGDGTFSEQAVQKGLADINSPHPCVRPLFFDFNNDGLKDLFVSTMYCHKLFEQLPNGKFRDVSSGSGLENECFYSIATNVLDYDRDGHLDLIVASYFKSVDFYDPHTTKFMQNSVTKVTNGGPVILYKNNGDGTFSKDAAFSEFDLHGFVIAAGVYDFNYDMFPDLWLSLDFNTNVVFLNNGDGTFKDISTKVSQTFSTNGMSAEIGDIFHNKEPYVFVTHIQSPANNVIGNQFWKFSDSGDIIDESKVRNVFQCGWAWGVKYIDLDNNSDEEIIVTNGYISQNPKKNFRYRLGELIAAGGEVLQDAKNWYDFNDYSLDGFQKNCLYYNKDGEFEDVASQTAMHDQANDGRAVASIDYLNNGSLSFVVTNQNQKTSFFHNEQRNKNNWIGLRLISKDGVPDVYGAYVEIDLKGKKLTRQSYYNNGFSTQSDSRIHFGLGEGLESVSGKVIWPNGKSQVFSDLKVNTYHELVEN